MFDRSAAYDPQQPLDELLTTVPAKWVVYLFTDADDQPVQLLCVKNLRASLKRRLGGDELVGPSRKVNYREIVRHVYWRRIDSAFEADLVYLDIARQIFPQSYRGMLGFDPAWFVHVNPDTNFPRYVKTIDLTRPGLLIGPVQDKHAAARLIQSIEDAFDLCRYYNVLVQAPSGKACAYKEMGKCPAPCDGTISMAQYRDMVRLGAAVAVAPRRFLDEEKRRMSRAAAALDFELAGRIKQRIDRVSQFGKGAFRHVRDLADFRYVSLQHGPRSGTAKIFLIGPGVVDEVAGLIAADVRHTEDLLRMILARARQMPADLSEQGVERVGVFSEHLFRARRVSGVYLPLADLEDRSFAKACRDLQKQKSPGDQPQSDDGEGDEGVVKELQQI